MTRLNLKRSINTRLDLYYVKDNDLHINSIGLVKLPEDIAY